MMLNFSKQSIELFKNNYILEYNFTNEKFFHHLKKKYEKNFLRQKKEVVLITSCKKMTFQNCESYGKEKNVNILVNNNFFPYKFEKKVVSDEKGNFTFEKVLKTYDPYIDLQYFDNYKILKRIEYKIYVYKLPKIKIEIVYVKQEYFSYYKIRFIESSITDIEEFLSDNFKQKTVYTKKPFSFLKTKSNETII